jgi:DNA-binding CsgD family transcriptional regulator
VAGVRRDADIARSAFDAVAAAQKAESIAELDMVLGRQIASLGFDFFVGLNVLDPGAVANVGVTFGKSYEPWERHYAEHAFHNHDAMLRELGGAGVDPLFWSDVRQRRPLEMGEIRVFNEASDFGLKEGFITPIHNLDGSMSAVLLVGLDADARDPDTRAAAHLLSLYYGSIAQKIRRAERLRALNDVKLTARQIECLKWVRHGKSSNDIGDLLGLSGRTVDHYLADACARLGVRTRHQAVIDAALRGVLQL